MNSYTLQRRGREEAKKGGETMREVTPVQMPSPAINKPVKMRAPKTNFVEDVAPVFVATLLAVMFWILAAIYG